jgi:hypothetical protein
MDWAATLRPNIEIHRRRPRSVTSLDGSIARAGAIKAGRLRQSFSGCRVLQAHVLTESNTAPRSRRLGRRHWPPYDLEVSLLVENRPGHAGQFVGERDREHVVMQPLLGGFDPLIEPVAIPIVQPEKHHPGRLHKQNAQVTIALLGDLAEYRAVSGRYLPVAPDRARHRSRAPSRTHHRFRSQQPLHSR